VLDGALHGPVFFRLERGVRQGGVLSPQLFAVYIDYIIGWLNHMEAVAIQRRNFIVGA